MSWNEVAGERDSSEKIPYSKFGAGNTMIRVLDEEPFSYWSHWLQQQQTSVACMGKDCPICNIIAQAKANKEKPMYNSTQRHAVRIWNYTTNQMEIMIQGRVFFGQLLDLHKEVGDITTYDIKIIRKGEGTDTVYTTLPSAPTDFDLKDKVITEIDFKEQFAPPSKEEMIMLIEGKTWSEINGDGENVA